MHYWFIFVQFSKSRFIELPIEYIRELRDVTVVEKESATLTCEPSRPSTDIKWFKDGKPIDIDGKKFTAVIDGKKVKLVIADAQLGDGGVYVCEIDDKRTSGTLTVEGIVEIYLHKAEINSFEYILDFCH